IRVRRTIHTTVTSIFIGAGFALSETLYLALGNRQYAVHRSYTTLPLHIITAVILSFSIKYKKKGLTVLAVVVHLTYNILL
ncbi:MAG: hypothetical protein B6229_09840, partial [Spirochaetaceae bacterium 4572_7]